MIAIRRFKGKRLIPRSLAGLSLFLLAGMGAPAASASPEADAARVFDEIAADPVLLRVFLRDMPKGGDLHIHSAGTPYAESFLEWASEAAFCIDVAVVAVVAPPCRAPETLPAQGLARSDPGLFARVVNAMSVREHLAGVDTGISGHDQFFRSFEKFGAIAAHEPARVQASARRAAARDAVSYLELMDNPGVINISALTSRDPAWNGDFEAAFARLQPEISAVVAAAIAETDETEAEARRLLACDTDAPDPGCDVVVYYNGFGLRLIPTDQLFRQLALSFALIEADPRFVGISLVQPEDDPVAIADYTLHMRMIAFLSDKYPAARISLHAGELTLGLAPADAMRRHIADAIDIAGSQRIGHGVDIAFELGSRETLARMAREQIAVEINLSSNDVILGVKGRFHPLNLYRRSGVPFVLSTDDEGVLRTDMTEQFVRAADEHGLRYLDLKEAARNSLHFAFLPGASLWQDAKVGERQKACRKLASPACQALVAASPKAQLQLKQEQAFDVFERDIRNWRLAPG